MALMGSSVDRAGSKSPRLVCLCVCVSVHVLVLLVTRMCKFLEANDSHSPCSCPAWVCMPVCVRRVCVCACCSASRCCRSSGPSPGWQPSFITSFSSALGLTGTGRGEGGAPPLSPASRAGNGGGGERKGWGWWGGFSGNEPVDSC